MNVDSTLLKKANRCALLIACVLVALTKGVAQSGDPNFPTPIHNNNLVGKIASRDLGDARLTRHYYAFKATPGDLLITVRSTNLNGDIDVFTATTLRPLLKITLYAESTAPVAKGVFLRRSEDLILRIEARSPNDDLGTYQLTFGGSFQPIYGQDVAETPNPTAEIPTTPSSDSKTKRVSSVGARIEEPAPPVTEVATAPTTPERTTESTPLESPTPVIIEKPAEAEPPKAEPPRTTGTRRATGRRTTRPTPKTTEAAKTAEADTPARPIPKATEAPKSTEAATPAETETETKPPAPAPARSTNKRASTTARSTKPPAEPEAEYGPRLIIETNDGTLINRSMSNVRRVTVENGQVVVVNKDGTTNRILLANVVKMAIQP
jgi:hypothetical protein